MAAVNLKRDKTTGRWTKGKFEGGACFTISPDRLEETLKTGRLPKAFPSWKLKKNECVERLVFDVNGITVFIGSTAE